MRRKREKGAKGWGTGEGKEEEWETVDEKEGEEGCSNLGKGKEKEEGGRKGKGG